MRHSQEVKKRAAALYAEGMPPYEISGRLGVPRQTIHRWVTPKGQAAAQRQKKDAEYKERVRIGKKAYRQIPEVKDKDRARKQTPEARERQKAYNQLPESKKRKNEYMKKRRATDPAFRTACLLRCRTYQLLRGIIKSASTEELLGISALALTQRWDAEYGLDWQATEDLHIDHIRPCSSFDMDDTAHQRLCFNWRNLQLLPAAENKSKKNRWTEKMESAWAARMRRLDWEGELFLIFDLR